MAVTAGPKGHKSQNKGQNKGPNKGQNKDQKQTLKKEKRTNWKENGTEAQMKQEKERKDFEGKARWTKGKKGTHREIKMGKCEGSGH